MSSVIIAIFSDKSHVRRVVDELSHIQGLEIGQAIVAMRLQTGELKILEGELSPQEARRLGRRFGAVMSALGITQFGALALPGLGPILAVGVGAILGGWVGGATGRFVGQLLSAGFQQDQIDQLTAHLKQDQIALLLEVENPEDLPTLRQALQIDSIDILETGSDALAQLPPSETHGPVSEKATPD
ncbi:MAG: hypothetical protein ACLFTK_15500 [Anaerolineales bacterium]